MVREHHSNNVGQHLDYFCSKGFSIKDFGEISQGFLLKKCKECKTSNLAI